MLGTFKDIELLWDLSFCREERQSHGSWYTLIYIQYIWRSFQDRNPSPRPWSLGVHCSNSCSYFCLLNPMAWDARCLWHWYDPDSFFEIAEESSGLGYCAAQRKKMTILTTWISHLFYFNVWYDWMFSSPSHLVIIFAHWQGAPSCWKRHSSSPARSWMIGRSCAHRMFWQRSSFVGNFESEPTPQAEKQTHTWMVSHALVLHFQCTGDDGAHLFLFRQASFQMPQTIRQEIYQRKWLYHSPQQPSLCIFCRILVCPSCFSMMLLCVCKWIHTCLISFLSYPSDTLVLLALPPWSILHNN